MSVGLIGCHKHSSLAGVLTVGEAVLVRGQETYGESLYVPLNSAVNLST